MTITTEPSGALIYINDQEAGRSELQRDFLWYGDYDIIIRKEGYQTLKTHWAIRAPWYEVPPMDFFSEVMWPGRIHDQRENHFVLVPQEEKDTAALQERALELRSQALGGRKMGEPEKEPEENRAASEPKSEPPQ